MVGLAGQRLAVHHRARVALGVLVGGEREVGERLLTDLVLVHVLLDQQGILINSAYKRFSLRANVNTDINKVVSFGLSWAGSKEAGNSPPYGGGTALSFTGQAVNIAPRWAPTASPYDADGNYTVVGIATSNQ